MSVWSFLAKIFGTKSDREIKKMLPIVEEINRFAEGLKDKSREDLLRRTEEFREEIREIRARSEREAAEHDLSEKEAHDFVVEREKEYLDSILPEAFAMVKETCRRLVGQEWSITGQTIKWDMVPYDVQLIGAIVLHRGKIAEMKTGEGKTLVATMPIYLNALTGRGVHIVTVNDYLAQRDSEWMGKIYEYLGLTVGCILNDMTPEQRREIYARDITYGTNNEFGFDYLRDNMAITVEDQVQRGHFYAIVDEVDSVLIDEARTPLIISGVVESETTQKYEEWKPRVENLVRKQTLLVNQLLAEGEKLLEKAETEYEGGIKILQAMRGAPKNKRLLKLLQEPGVKTLARRVENDFMRDKKMHVIDEVLYFSIDEKSNIIDLMEKGREALSPANPDQFVIPDLGEEISRIDDDESLSEEEKRKKKEELHRLHSERSEEIHNISQLLRAYSLFEKDVEYVVQDGKVLIVDEFTGRILPGRRYSEGLHQAIEAKEGVRVERETQTLATITLQNYFRLYDKLAGMTGTAATEADEFMEIYKLDVTVIPTNMPVIRKDYEDRVYKTRREKYNAILNEIEDCHRRGQPTLVGTISVEVSETLSRMLKRRNIPHNVLNAKHHKREAEIVARAGQKGAVTIATNMAGRGTDIKLGEGVKEVGGLHIIGTERHEARRIDLQLRGRSGRQGDPGSSRFYLSLEDDLMRLFGSERIARIMDRLGVKEGEVITHPMITRSIERAQKKVEARNFSIRKHLLEYDDVMNQQREVIYARRNSALIGKNLKEEIQEMIDSFIDVTVDKYTDSKSLPEEWDWNGLRQETMAVLSVDVQLDELEDASPENIARTIRERAMRLYKQKEQLAGEELMRRLEQYVYLRTVDEKWKDHLYAIDQLKEGISLRAYGQKDPLIEYKREAYQMFMEMLDDIERSTVQLIFRAQPVEQTPQMRRMPRARIQQLQHEQAMGMGFVAAQPDQQERQQAQARPKMQPIRVAQKVGRNDPCPCGSGKKYKKCHGRNV